MGSQLDADNGVKYSLDMELSNLELWVKKTENGDMSEFKLREILDIYENRRVSVCNTFKEVNRIHNIIEFEEETNEEKIEGDEGSKEIIKKKIERIESIGEHKGLEEKED